MIFIFTRTYYLTCMNGNNLADFSTQFENQLNYYHSYRKESRSCKNKNHSCFNIIAKLDESFVTKAYCVDRRCPVRFHFFQDGALVVIYYYNIIFLNFKC